MKQLLVIIILLIPTLVTAAVQPDDELVSVFEYLANDYSVPPSIAMAIARHESGFNPYAVNVAGKSYMPKTKEEALAIIESAQKSNKSYDIGLMQVNSWWLKRLGIKASDALEIANNISLGLFILAKEIDTYGPSWKAIAAYHTPIKKNPARAKAYAKKIYYNFEKVKKYYE